MGYAAKNFALDARAQIEGKASRDPLTISRAATIATVASLMVERLGLANRVRRVPIYVFWEKMRSVVATSNPF